MKVDLLICLAAMTLSMNLFAEEKNQQNPDWPCEQIYIYEISPAVVWAGPSTAGMEALWQQDEEIQRLVNRFTSPDYDVENADKEIADFAERQNPEEKDRKLTLLFSGVLEALNNKRKKELNGITRYARGQAARANRLSEELDEMIGLQDDPSPAAQERFQLMQSEMEIKQRMFDEREAFIQHLCTRPRIVEERLGTLARAIAYYLD